MVPKVIFFGDVRTGGTTAALQCYTGMAHLVAEMMSWG